jgi:hypothetical protein
MDGFDDLRRTLRPEPALLDAFVAAALKESRQAEAIDALKPLYAAGRPKPVYEALRRLMTGPDFAALEPPDEPRAAQVLPMRPYGAMLPGALVYPFTSLASIVVLLMGGWAFGAAGFFLRQFGTTCLCGSLAAAAIMGYLIAFLFAALQESAAGSRRAPGWGHAWNIVEAFAAFWRWTVASVVCWFPSSLMGVLWAVASAAIGPGAGIPFIVLAAIFGLVGLVYHPMALMIAASSDTWVDIVAVPKGTRAIRHLGRDYGLCAGYCVMTWLATVAAPAILAWLKPEWALPLVSISGWLSFYVYMTQMRAAGLLLYVRAPFR